MMISGENGKGNSAAILLRMLIENILNTPHLWHFSVLAMKLLGNLSPVGR